LTVPWQAIGTGASDRLIALGARFRPYRGTLLTGAVRGLLVSPWFAAGAGFVVAAGAFMYAPHAQLSFGNPLIGRTPCTVAKCHPPTAQGGAPPVPAGVGIGPVTPSAAASVPATAGLTFRYVVNWHTHDTFSMVLTVTGKKAIGNWQLSFVIPGASNISVLGADWKKSGTDGVSASGSTFGDGDAPSGPLSTPAPGRPSPDPGSDSVSAQPDAVYLVVNGDGAPTGPAGCSFDGVPCHFHQIS
jgi:hypothetical protein